MLEQELDSLVSEWGEMSYHAPILLAWTVFKFMTHFGTDLEVIAFISPNFNFNEIFLANTVAW